LGLISVKRAFFSTADRTGLVTLAQGLHELGVELLALGETASFLRAARLPVEPVPRLFEIISAIRQGTVQLIVATPPPLSPAAEAMPREDDLDAIALLMAGACAGRSAAAVVDPQDYSAILEELRERGALRPETSRRLAERAFNFSLRYCTAIAKRLASQPLPAQLNLAYLKAIDLSEAEGKRQAALYSQEDKPKFPRQLP
jgi:phosphoribosylaminoimidazolecarboxamide formyltransferase/IMP cyclohydrolase